MVEELMQVAHTHPSAVGIRIDPTPTARRYPATDGRGTLIAPLVRRLCSPLVRLADLISLTLALFLTIFSTSMEQGQTLSGFLALRVSVRNLVIEMAFLVTWRAIFWMSGLYQPRLNRSASTFLWRVPLTVVVCAITMTPLLLLTSETLPAALRLGFVFWFAGTTLMLATRAAYYTYEEHVRPAFRTRRNILVIGTGPRARLMTLQLADHPDFKYQLCGFVDSDPQPECDHMAALLGGVDDLETILMRQPIDEVLIALPIKSGFSEIQQVVAICGRAGIQTQYSLDLFTTDIAKNQSIDENTGGRVVEMVINDHRMFLKSVMDRTAAALGLLALAPLLLILAALVKLTSKGPVFFVQQRFGKGKRTFGMIKFRSMVADAEARQAQLEHMNEHKGPTFKIKRDPRVTALGQFLRRTSMDELPQLINVLKGDMSLVGPRPLPTRDVERFSEPWLMRRFSVKPGITGLWQVSGRADTDFDQTIKLDLRYIDRWSLLLDVKILLRTFGAVFKGRGAF